LKSWAQILPVNLFLAACLSRLASPEQFAKLGKNSASSGSPCRSSQTRRQSDLLVKFSTGKSGIWVRWDLSRILWDLCSVGSSSQSTNCLSMFYAVRWKQISTR